MAKVWKRFQDGGDPLGSGDLLADLDVPRMASVEIVEALVAAGLLARAAEPEDGLLPARDLNEVTVGEVLHEFRHCGEGTDGARVRSALGERLLDIHGRLETAFEASGEDPLPAVSAAALR